MPGIYGVASSIPIADLPERMDAMSRVLWHHDWYREDAHVDESGLLGFGRVTTGHVNAAEQPARNEDNRLLAVMEGEIYDFDAHRHDLIARGHRFQGSSHAELLLHGFEQYGIGFFPMVHGKFAAAIWDKQARRLHLVNDRFGMKPLYYSHRAGRLYFGSEVKSLLNDQDTPRRLDLRGLAQFITFGQLLGEDTLFDQIRLLPAAGWLTIDTATNRISVERYWRLKGQVHRNRAESEALDRIDTAFAASVKRMTANTEGLGLSLSGGLDARTILGVMGEGKAHLSLSLGMSGSLDHRCAAEMAAAVNCQHEQVVLGKEFLAAYESHLRHMVRLTDGQYLCQCIVMPTLPLYREFGVKVLLRGHAGELMHMTKAYNFSLDRSALELRSESELFQWLWRRMQSFMLEGVGRDLFAARHRSAIEDLARESLRDCIRETAATEPTPHRIWQLFFEQRSRRETALSLAEFESVVETRLPYLDNEVVEELFSVAPQMKLSDRIQTHILRRHRPEYLNIVNANTGARLNAGRFATMLARGKRRVFAKLGVPGYQPYERLGLWLRQEIQPLVKSLLLAERCLGRGVFDPETVRRVVDDHMNNRQNHTYLLLALMTIEAGQQEFFDRGASIAREALAV